MNGYQPTNKITSPPPSADSSVQPKYHRPPLGVMPRFIHDENRLEELRECIYRHLVDGRTPILIEWITEYNELIRRCE